MRKAGLFLVGLGAFLVMMGLMIRLYAYPTLAVAPTNPDSTTSLIGEGATIFDTSTLSEMTTDLSTQVITTGDAEAQAEAPDGVVVWVSKTSTTSSDGVIRSRDVELIPHNEVTGEAVDCCGSYEEVVEGVRDEVVRSGLVLKFPFNTQKKSYDFWDADTRQAYAAKYTGTETINGLKTYTFVQEVPRTEIGILELPADLLGESGDDNLTADKIYSNTRTFWVEPNTGAVVDRTEDVSTTIAYDGTDRITATAATMRFTDEQVTEGTDKYAKQGSQLALVRSTVPLGAGILGLLLLVAGLVIASRRRSEVA